MPIINNQHQAITRFKILELHLPATSTPLLPCWVLQIRFLASSLTFIAVSMSITEKTLLFNLLFL